MPFAVRKLLQGLRERIRRYVILEAAAMLVVCLVIAFWIGLAMDYLPVLIGASEMPRSARLVLLLLVGLCALGVIYQYLLRRVFYPIRDSSLALLIERQFPELRDSLITTVELGATGGNTLDAEEREILEDVVAAESGDVGADMFAETVRQAAAGAEEVRLAKVFRYRPLATKLVAAAASAASVIVMGIQSPHLLTTAAARLIGLSETPWERYAYIELVGFTNGQCKIARGTDLTVHVRADATRDVPPPQLCSILYRTQDGDRGRVNMSRDGEPREGFQYYVFNGKPFKGILGDIDFDVIGYDYRLRDQRVVVVESPVVTGVQLRCELPEYTRLVPREESWNPGSQFPMGSRITARIQTNKNIVRVAWRDIDTDEEGFTSAPEDQPIREFVHEIASLQGRVAVAITLLDTDGIESLEPFLLTIGAVEDNVPVVDVALKGIGNAITPYARLPISGRISDDYEIARRWFALQINDVEREFDLPAGEVEHADVSLDLRAESAAERSAPLQIQPEDRVLFSVKATDYFNLGGQEHVGSSDQVALTVVRPDELLAILDGRELGLRRRFEQIRTETMQSRDSLARLRASFQEVSAEDGEDIADTDNENEQNGNLESLQSRWATWAKQKTDQTSSEVSGVALAFEDIRDELVNNRVDTPERKSRLEQQIIAPLNVISDELLQDLETQLVALELALRESRESAEPLSVETLRQADQVVIAMDAVLEKMLELEDYTELVNIIRQILEEQGQLLEKTKEERDRAVLDLLR